MLFNAVLMNRHLKKKIADKSMTVTESGLDPMAMVREMSITF